MKLYGASGHGKVILDIAVCNQETVSCFIDDYLNASDFCGLDVLRSNSILASDELVIAIGNNEVRQSIVKKLKPQKLLYPRLVHPNTSVASSVTLGEGTVVVAGAVVNSDTVVGAHAIINTNSSVDHDCVIGDFVHISPGANLCGNVQVGNLTHIGAGATVIPGVKIGSNCMIGAGATVISDLPDNCTAVGTPARIIHSKQNSVFIFGAGGFGAEIIGDLSSFGFELAGIADDRFKEIPFSDSDSVAICIGSSVSRSTVYRKLVKTFPRLQFPNLIHETVNPFLKKRRSNSIGIGNVVCAETILTTRIQLGDFNLINLNCTIGHDTVIGNFVSIMPSVNLGGNVIIEDGVFIGTNATILPGVKVGKDAVIAAGAVVVKDVPSGTTVKGIPAK